MDEAEALEVLQEYRGEAAGLEETMQLYLDDGMLSKYQEAQGMLDELNGVISKLEGMCGIAPRLRGSATKGGKGKAKSKGNKAGQAGGGGQGSAAPPAPAPDPAPSPGLPAPVPAAPCPPTPDKPPPHNCLLVGGVLEVTVVLAGVESAAGIEVDLLDHGATLSVAVEGEFSLRLPLPPPGAGVDADVRVKFSKKTGRLRVQLPGAWPGVDEGA
eukprot:CAMPEP_0182897950 /NCGR_PEP_ID=MMETSP0034_2-20130328/27198_1 /TAXON_ID=156128 /ORGANISM="Nephroselmis pyriformis, Strain CCMP717" /LENGTH=213 /DNA_ID=CAMNT_0025031893 /DNA_START=87 /DNA_END=724 /DNA_ORIENTATION=-